ncbi:hypothetical protein B0T19DRAFT_426095 [Cercophora scortea]|uniref:Uncharacterized protein n=1 Tax=Cercophora scortea TaxID=314031 RepID=A0AAE0IE69_9PEZI|nr:hypothetical protein B0T19DRAFT_426095 [Cercophora scortea]
MTTMVVSTLASAGGLACIADFWWALSPEWTHRLQIRRAVGVSRKSKKTKMGRTSLGGDEPWSTCSGVVVDRNEWRCVMCAAVKRIRAKSMWWGFRPKALFQKCPKQSGIACVQCVGG